MKSVDSHDQKPQKKDVVPDLLPSGDHNMVPRDAASLIILDRSGSSPKVFMGQRASKQVFLPDKFVFPGGGYDTADANCAFKGMLSPTCQHSILHDMVGEVSLARAHGLAITALRETYEEVGFLFGQNDDQATDRTSGDTTNGAADARHQMSTYAAHQLRPDLSQLTFFARAITPPGRPRRYDTRFFVVDATHIAKRVAAPDNELRNQNWYTIEDVEVLDLPRITRAILSDLRQHETGGPPASATWRAPFYFFEDGQFRRVLLPRH